MNEQVNLKYLLLIIVFWLKQGIVTNRDEERDQLRHELQKTRDQLAEQLVLQVVSHPTSTSRPVSHVSLSDCEATIESEQSEGAPASPEVDVQAPNGKIDRFVQPFFIFLTC